MNYFHDLVVSVLQVRCEPYNCISCSGWRGQFASFLVSGTDERCSRIRTDDRVLALAMFSFSFTVITSGTDRRTSCVISSIQALWERFKGTQGTFSHILVKQLSSSLWCTSFDKLYVLNLAVDNQSLAVMGSPVFHNSLKC